MKSILYTFLFFLSILTSIQTASAQAPKIEISTTKVKVGTEFFYVHKVKQKETLYSICRAYNVTVEELSNYNPLIKEGLKFDQDLYIPIKEEVDELETPPASIDPATTKEEKPKKATVVILPENPIEAINNPELPVTEVSTVKSTDTVTIGNKVYYNHIVTAGQTIYFLSRLYNISSAEIYAGNPGLSESLSLGQQVKLLCKNCEVIKTPVVNEEEKKPKKDKALKHIIKENETVYGISQTYNIPPEVIYMFNPELLDSLEVGKEINIPNNKTWLKKDFIYYQLDKDEILGKISQKFRVTEEEIIENNPRVAIELVEGSFIKIPVNNDNTKLANENISEYEDYSFHTVQPKETVYSITKAYDISEKDFYKLNKNVSKSELSISTILKVPAKENTSWYIYSDTITRKLNPIEQNEQTVESFCDTLGYRKQKVNVALFLPLYLIHNNSFAASPEIINKPKELYKPSIRFIEYYEGVLLGLDSLKSLGINVNLKVYDTNKDTLFVKNILNKISQDSIDLIIGPIYPEIYSLVSKFGLQNKIPVISPLAATENCTSNNPYAIQLNAPERLRYATIGEKIVQNKNAHIIVVYNSVVLEQNSVDKCIATFKNRFADSIQLNNITVSELLFSDKGIKGLEAAMDPGGENIIIVVSKNQAFINNMVTKLYKYVHRYPIQLYGLTSWQRYENIELEFLFDLHFHYATNSDIDYSNKNVQNFVKTYREVFKTEPSKFSFQGFDHILYFVESVAKFDTNILECLPAYNKEGLNNSFEFIKENNGDGLINKAIKIVEYSVATKDRPAQIK